jgi:hypothetical protein
MSRWLAIIALILTANVFTISEASAWSISHADAERLCVGKASEHYHWGYSCAWCGEGLLRGATTLLAATWVVARLCEGTKESEMGTS